MHTAAVLLQDPTLLARLSLGNTQQALHRLTRALLILSLTPGLWSQGRVLQSVAMDLLVLLFLDKALKGIGICHLLTITLLTQSRQMSLSMACPTAILTVTTQLVVDRRHSLSKLGPAAAGDCSKRSRQVLQARRGLRLS